MTQTTEEKSVEPEGKPTGITAIGRAIAEIRELGRELESFMLKHSDAFNSWPLEMIRARLTFHGAFIGFHIHQHVRKAPEIVRAFGPDIKWKRDRMSEYYNWKAEVNGIELCIYRAEEFDNRDGAEVDTSTFFQ